jgi:amino acid adenylation domain-containing protein
MISPDVKRSLLEKWLRGELGSATLPKKIPRRDADAPIPLSYSQEQVWMHAQLVPDVPLYNEPVTIHYAGALDPAALEQAFNEILRRHEAWRTSFRIVEGNPVQVVTPELSISLPVIDLRELPEEKREIAALIVATEEARKPLDLGYPPLFRASLMRLEDQQYRLYLTLSHIIFDGVAIYRVFLPELAALYAARVAGQPPTLKVLDIQYTDFSCWQRKARGDVAAHIAYWRRQLRELPILDLPSDRPRPAVQTFHGSMYAFKLSPSATEAVWRAGRQEGATVFQMLLATFAALLGRYSGQNDFSIGSVTAGRDRPETTALLGYFLNTVVLRADLSGDPSFRELLRRMREVALAAMEHDDIPFGLLLQELNVSRNLSRNPLFQVMFSLEPPMPEVDSAWCLTQMDIDTGATKYDLYLELDERQDEILARFHYSTDLFDTATVTRMAEHWMNLVAGAASDPELRVSQLPLLSESEKNQLLIGWNQTQAESPKSGGIHDLFNAQCERTPDAVAINEGPRQLTFFQLQQQSNRLAHYLQKKGAGHGTRVALCVERSLEMVVALLGIIKTGAAYVPLDPSYPVGRLQFMLEDAEPILLVSQSAILKKVPFSRAKTVALDTDWQWIAQESENDLSTHIDLPPIEAIDPAYVLYTSGSSGRPKGVEGTHGGALNRFQWMWERYPFAAGEVCCQKTNLGFVDAVWEIFGPLLAGVRSVILPPEVVRDPEELLQSLARHGVTRMVLVPSLLRALLDHAPQLEERVPRLQLWSCSGEALSGELAERFRQGFPGARLLNIYGASEVAADVTWHEVGEREAGEKEAAGKKEAGKKEEAGKREGGEKAKDRSGTVAIGKPIRNTQIYVLDGHGNVVPVGVRGEIYVGGAGLALGYWNRAELTAERFVENGIAPEKSKRLYRTGDLGRWRGDGELEYLGRVDGEVKLRGMRIDLGEIETVLMAHAGVRAAAVERVEEREEEGGEARLVAYVVAAAEEEEEATPSAGELRGHLRAKLPEHMVPSRYVVLPELPLLASGKVNRRALRTAGGRVLSEQGMAQPRTETERGLAEIWKELLKVEEVGVEQNFFEMGGHSLLVLQVMARIRRRFGLELAVRTVFEEPTIRGLAVAVEKAEAQGQKAQTPILERRVRPPPPDPTSREALLAQLGQLSKEEAQILLEKSLHGKPYAGEVGRQHFYGQEENSC